MPSAAEARRLVPICRASEGADRRAEILDAILDPSAKIHPDFASTLVGLKSGRVVQGLIRPLNETKSRL